MLGTIVKPAERYSVGDVVYLATDKRREPEPGTVAIVDGETFAPRYFVTWQSGRTWIYSADMLTRAAA